VIARTWRGRTQSADAGRYAAYVARTGLAAYRGTAGNRGAILLHRVDGETAEILTISFWDSLDDVRAFAGDDISRAVFYPEDDAYLVDRDKHADHWEVAEADLSLGLLGCVAERVQ
jgi:heme-degrading monooxygenase HmoA